MNLLHTNIDGVLIIEPHIFGDKRGYFFESFNAQQFAQQTGIDTTFVQDNESLSQYGVVRGLHFQQPPYTQAKLVRVVVGTVLDVVVDLRKGSRTYGQHVAVELTADNHRQLYIPRGMAHGFAVLSPTALFQYKCDQYYHPEAEGAIAWNDPDLAIDWRIPTADIILSEKDSHHPTLRQFNSQFVI